MKDRAHSLLRDKKVRYLISGGTAFVVEYLLFMALLWATNLLYLANSISFAIGVGVGFMFHKHWSFAGKHRLQVRHQITIYAVMAITNFFLTNIVIGLLVNGVDVPPSIAKVLVILMIIVWNYLVFSRLIFSRRET